jgi:hypothetical protein
MKGKKMLQCFMLNDSRQRVNQKTEVKHRAGFRAIIIGSQQYGTYAGTKNT